MGYNRNIYMFKHFFVSLGLYFSLIITSLLILGISKHFDQEGKQVAGGQKTTSSINVERETCKAFKFDKCK